MILPVIMKALLNKIRWFIKRKKSCGKKSIVKSFEPKMTLSDFWALFIVANEIVYVETSY